MVSTRNLGKQQNSILVLVCTAPHVASAAPSTGLLSCMGCCVLWVASTVVYIQGMHAGWQCHASGAHASQGFPGFRASSGRAGAVLHVHAVQCTLLYVCFNQLPPFWAGYCSQLALLLLLEACAGSRTVYSGSGHDAVRMHCHLHRNQCCSA